MKRPHVPRRQNRKQVSYDLLLFVLLCVLVIAMGPDPVYRDAAAFARVTVPRLGLAAVAVYVGRRYPLAALVLLLPMGPWRFTEGFATVDLSWLLPRRNVKIFPLLPSSMVVIWYAFLTGRRMVRLWPALVAFCLISLVGVAVVLTQGGDLALWVSMVTALTGTYLVPYLFGLLRRRLLHQRQQARLSGEAQARLRERARIARDMHDSLGHDLALIAVRAAGLELAPGLAPAQVKAAGELRVAAADATERLRQIIGLLRDDADAAPLAPVGEDVSELVRRAADSGMSITLHGSTDPSASALVHAVVQEGLTNAAKHAPGAAVEVTLSPHRIRVRNEPPRSRPTARSGGLGLAGLRERVRLSGGTLTAGPYGDGFELTVTLPHETVTLPHETATHPHETVTLLHELPHEREEDPHRS
ncbi:signal transduction histidine kinase [Nonomuraea fuscirosea]|uniref:histidine kinase n=1 Tax=Nonomuraea fuscirosea TaxID=1291556 RepID=A0A2T0M4R1_9ACTN|nr:histidine kinase [Nonomuraea fuscirosea]PRX52060.1 signal transduction histidine kinase [Nonomuraea fuscirosea]